MRSATAAAMAALAASLGAALPGAGAAAPGDRGRGCAAPASRVLARGAAMRIYETRPPAAGGARAVLACLAGHRGHMTLLAPTQLNRHTSLARFLLAGHVAGYLETQFGVDAGTTKLVVVDVGARRVLHAIEAGSYVDAGLIFREAVVRFVLTSRGSVAWSVTREDHHQGAVASVYAAPREGPPSLLDSGAAIEAGSLSLTGVTLSWTDGGSPRAAPMP